MNVKRNKYLFMIGDERCVDLFGSDFAKSWPLDRDNKIYITGDNIKDLGLNIRKRVEKLYSNGLIKKNEPDFYELSDFFEEILEQQAEKFNSYAETGKDIDFHRGEAASELEWTVSPTNDKPNHTMYPLDLNNKMYCIIICASMIDTKSGPDTDCHGRVLTTNNKPIDGLYAGKFNILFLY